jgi:type II secretory pathway pseudopilin PulG
MALTKCHECGQEISTTAAVCPKCGAKPKRTSGCAVVVLIVIALAVVGSILGGIGQQANRQAQEQRAAEQRQRDEAAAKQQANALAQQRDSVLTAAREAVAKGDFDGASKTLAPFSAVKDADLDQIRSAIAAHDKQEREAEEKKGLLKIAGMLKPDAADEGIRVYGRLAQLEPGNKDFANKLARFQKIKPEVDAKNQAKADLQARKAFAQATEERFLSQGMSATVTAQGPSSTTLHIKFVLVSKAFAYQVQHADDFISACRRLGFKKIEMYDGYSEGWTLPLQ